MIEEATDLIDKKDYLQADGILYKIKNFLEPSTLTWPIILEAALIKNRIHLEKSEDARKIKDWDAARKHLDDFKTGFYQDRDIQGDTLTFGRPGLKDTRGEKAEKKELELAEDMEKRIKDDQRDPYRRDITEYTMGRANGTSERNVDAAKVQFINGDRRGYRDLPSNGSEISRKP